MKNRFLDALAERVLLCDGGMGTVLYGKVVYLNTCFDELNLTNPAIVKEVHREYVRSGVDIIETNTFGANRLKLRKYGLNDKVGDINRSGAAIAREEAGEAIFVAGSVGPLGARIAPLGHLSAAEAEGVFAEQAAALRDGGVGCVNIPDGPRASARMSLMALAVILTAEAGVEVLLHYTCRDRNLLGMQSDFLGLQANRIRNMLIITGDPPKLGDYPSATAVFDVDSIGLTSVVSGLNHGVDIGGKSMAKPTSFLIGVGVNPGAINRENEIMRFERKIEAGAEFAITQPVFDIRVLESFLEKTARFRVPILGGIWPLWSLANAEFMHNEVPGASVPPAVMERMRRAQDKGPDFARGEGVAIARVVMRDQGNGPGRSGQPAAREVRSCLGSAGGALGSAFFRSRLRPRPRIPEISFGGGVLT